MTESIPVVAFLVSADGSQTKLYGFVSSVTADVGLVVCAEKGKPGDSSSVRVPIMGGEFVFGDKREMTEGVREDFAAKYGEAVLVLYLPSGSIFSLIFNP